MSVDACVRALEASDSLVELTSLLNRAYDRLARQGFNYVAATQDVAMTRERIDGAECYVAVLAGRIVGTICFYAERGGGPASFGQFAVEPDLQGNGLGTRLVALVEERARALGSDEIECDTAEGVTRLVAYYKRLGYEVRRRVRWGHATYDSLILGKRR